MEPAVRVELTTNGLQIRCSATELRWLKGTADYANIAVKVNTPDSIFPFSALTHKWMRFAQSQVAGAIDPVVPSSKLQAHGF